MSVVPRVTLGVAVAWLGLAGWMGWWLSQRAMIGHLDSLAANAEYETKTTARIVDRLFTEMTSVANMVARQDQVIRLATRYRVDPPGLSELTRTERAEILTADPLVRSVGHYMTNLSNDLKYDRIYMNNLSYNTVTSSHWTESFNIVGQIYTGRGYLVDALRQGNGQMFGIARLNQMPSYFVASRIEDAEGLALGSVTVRFDAPEIAQYLTGRHISLIVNRQGRVTTASSASFALRNVAALLPPDTLEPPDGDEAPGEPMTVQRSTELGRSDHWLIDGHAYLLRRLTLSNTEYQLVTLARLDHLTSVRQQHAGIAGLVIVFGLIAILFGGRAFEHIMFRRQEDRYAANHDALTGLPNRRAILAELDRIFLLAQRTQRWVLVAFIDLDGFKSINDTYGHAVGDRFLIEAGRRFLAGMRGGDILGRWGGDEFILIGLNSPREGDDPDAVVDAMRSRLAVLLAGHYTFGECSFFYHGASIGVINFDPLETTLDDALRQADQLMYADKKARRRNSRT